MADTFFGEGAGMSIQRDNFEVTTVESRPTDGRAQVSGRLRRELLAAEQA